MREPSDYDHLWPVILALFQVRESVARPYPGGWDGLDYSPARDREDIAHHNARLDVIEKAWEALPASVRAELEAFAAAVDFRRDQHRFGQINSALLAISEAGGPSAMGEALDRLPAYDRDTSLATAFKLARSPHGP